MEKRFNVYDKSLYEFITSILVKCPKCSKKAYVKSNGISGDENEVKIICLNCGMNRYYSETPTEKVKTSKNGKIIEMRQLIIGGNVDPFFKFALWLQKDLSSGLLWAYNYEHLAFLENHVSAKLRERNINEMQNKSLGSRLPKWITSKKKQSRSLNGIKKLKLSKK